MGDTTKSTSKKIKGLTVGGAALAYISTIIGAGIIALPYAFAKAGPLFATMLHIVMAISLMIACALYFKTKDILGYESFSELSYICLGRTSIFVLNTVIAIGCFSIIVMYVILFSRISISLFENFL
jgi:amino acid permease